MTTALSTESKAVMTDSHRERRGRHKIGAIIGIILCIVLIPLLVVNVTLIVKSFVYPDKIPDFMGYKPFIVLSGSMEPAIMTGDLVITAKADTEDLKVGDVIAYRYGKETVITHRIREVSLDGDKRAFITKGDANNVEDNVMPTEDLVEGKLRWTVPGLGNVAMFLQTPYGLLAAAGVPLLIYLLYDLLRRRQLEKTEKAKSLQLQEELDRMKQQLAEGNAQDTPEANKNDGDHPA